MKIVDGGWNLIIVGRWNKHILTPDWVSENLFKEKDIKVEVPIYNPELPPRYTSSHNIVFMPAVHRVSFIAQEPYDDEMFSKIEQMSRQLLDILNHTPVSALGINFGFEESTVNFDNLDLFDFSDAGDFADKGYELQLAEIKRSFRLEDGKNLNFSLNNNQEKMILDFNFHYEVPDAEKAKEVISDGIIKKNRDITLGILSEIYGLTLEEED